MRIGSNTFQVEGRPYVIVRIARACVEKRSPESRVGPKVGIGDAGYFQIASNCHVRADCLDILRIREAHPGRPILLPAVVRVDPEMAMHQMKLLVTNLANTFQFQSVRREAEG